MEDGTDIVLSVGQLFFSSAEGQGHKHLPASQTWKLCWFQFEVENTWLVSAPEDYIVKNSIFFNEIHYVLEQIILEVRAEYLYHKDIENLYSQLLHSYIKRELMINNIYGYQQMYLKRFNELWKAISVNISERWDIAQICSFMHLSSAQVNRLCKKYFNMSPAKKVREIKMSYAKELICSFEYSISNIAELTGYLSVSAFSLAFKNHFGYPPSDLRHS